MQRWREKGRMAACYLYGDCANRERAVLKLYFRVADQILALYESTLLNEHLKSHDLILEQIHQLQLN